MTCYDIIFPLALGPLTYLCPEHLEGRIEPGMLVSAPLKKRTAQGIVLRRNDAPPLPVNRTLKYLESVSGDTPVLSRQLMKLLLWMSEYYIAGEGLVLKQTVPPEIFNKTGLHRQRRSPQGENLELPEIAPAELHQVLSGIREKGFRTFLHHAHSVLQEYALVRAVLGQVRNAIVLVPEIARANLLYQTLLRDFGERLCVLHSGMSKGRRTSAVDGIISNTHDVVIGTRLSLFAPMKRVSVIIVLHEHSSFYKMEEGIRFHLRDVAVKRGAIEKATVILSSVTPSIDTYYNTLTGKYELLSIIPGEERPRPRVAVVDMRYCKKTAPALSKNAVDLARKNLAAGRNVMFVINRKGYSILQCSECEHIEDCPDCSVPMVLHKDNSSLRCHYCGRTAGVPRQCPRCGSIKLEQTGAGTERVQEELVSLLHREVIRFDRDRLHKPVELRALLKRISQEPPHLLVGTRLMTTHLGPEHRFGLAVIVNVDSGLNFPDFRASEKSFAELSSILEHVEAGGSMLIQTRRPSVPMLKFIRSADYRSFINQELDTRKALSFPPFARLIGLTIEGRTVAADPLVKFLEKNSPSVEVLGPVMTTSKEGHRLQSLLLKSIDRQALNNAARAVLRYCGADEEIRIRVDVDPV